MQPKPITFDPSTCRRLRSSHHGHNDTARAWLENSKTKHRRLQATAGGHAKVHRTITMIDGISAMFENITSLVKGLWQVFIIPIVITAWAVYRDVMLKRGQHGRHEQTDRQHCNIEHEQHVADLSARHQEYLLRIESDFQELLKQLNEAEAEATLLRREKWQADLQVRAWRHSCRDAQQMVWALQRQGCSAGSELTRFKQVDLMGQQSSESQ